MYYPQDVIDDVRLGNDIVDIIGEYVRLTRKGRIYFGLCPFHSEKTPSFSVNGEKQMYYCYGCHNGGNLYTFIQQKENMTFMEAIEYLAERINYKLPEQTNSKAEAFKREMRQQLWDIHKAAARFYYDCLNSEQGREAMAYLESRGITKAIRNKFGLGYSPIAKGALNNHLLSLGFEQEMILKSGLVNGRNDGNYYDKFFNRVMFPIIDVRGNIIAFGGRIMGQGEPKYLNSQETEIFNKSHNLYNLNLAKLANKKELILVEGYMDVIALYQAGFKNVVAALGTAFNTNHTNILKRYTKNVVLLFDSDSAGVNAALRAIPILTQAGIKTKVLQVTDAKDPDEFIKKFGAEAFDELLQKKSLNQIMFRINVLKSRYSLDNADDKIAFTNGVVDILAEIENNVEREVYVEEVSKSVGISLNALRTEIDRIKGRQNNKSNNGTVSNKVKTVMVNNALEDAKKDLINLFAGDKLLLNISKKIFDKKEFADEFYIRLYDIIEQLHTENRPVHEADILTRAGFDDPKLQAKLSIVFMGQLPFDNDDEKKIAFLDDLKIIKGNYIDYMMETTDDENLLQDLIDKKCNLENLMNSVF